MLKRYVSIAVLFLATSSFAQTPSPANSESVTYNQWFQPDVSLMFGTQPSMQCGSSSANLGISICELDNNDLPFFVLGPKGMLTTNIHATPGPVDPLFTVFSHDLTSNLVMFDDGSSAFIGELNDSRAGRIDIGANLNLEGTLSANSATLGWSPYNLPSGSCLDFCQPNGHGACVFGVGNGIFDCTDAINPTLCLCTN